MHRQSTVSLSRRSLIGALSASLLTRGSVRAQSSQPDVVLAICDDLRASDWSALSRTVAAVNGTMLPSAISTTPVCAPARASILTGR